MKHRLPRWLALGLLLPVLLALRPRQELEYTLLLKAYAGASGSDYRISLTRRPGYVLARYEQLDSLQSTRLAKDKQVRVLCHALAKALSDNSLARADKARAEERLMTRLEAFKVYRVDSLRLETETTPGFAQLLDSVYIASTFKLEQPGASRRIVLDGTSVSVVISSPGSESRVVRAYAPGPVSHPLLYRVLHQSLQMYRSRRPQGLLPASYTQGY